MTSAGWTTALAVCMLALPPQDGGAQSRGTKAPAMRTTLSGVYTAEQAARGRYVYVASCRACHSAESHTGVVFAKWWKGKPLSELYNFIGERMPKNDPGTLAYEDVADVTAYLLKMNVMPPGKAELPPDSVPLKKIRIEMVTKRSKQP